MTTFSSARFAFGTLLLAGAGIHSAAAPRTAEAQTGLSGRTSPDTVTRATHERNTASVDVFSRVEILETGQSELASALNELLPSAYFPRRQVADLTSGVRPFQLRGLSPDHTLVLLNGKRRHATAVVHTLGGGAFPGASGVDINALPLQAIDRLEVVRDGGTTRHGSDAIAGVIDLRLRNTVSAPEFIASVGHHFPDEWDDDGLRYDFSGNWGLGIGRGGVLNLTSAFSQRDPTNRAGADGRDQILPGDADFVDRGLVIRKHNEVAQPNHLWGDGESSNFMLFANFELPLAAARAGPGGAELYAFGGYSRRRDRHSGFFVRSMDDRNWPGIHPLGFLPRFDADSRDVAIVTGFRGGGEDLPGDGSGTDAGYGFAGDWSWDLNAQYGSNRIDNDLFDTLNPSLGPCLESACAPGPDGIPGTADDPGIPNRTRFSTGSLENRQFLANADVRGRIEMGLGGGPASVALGATFRLDSYRILAGEPASRVDGFHPTQSGGIAPAGSQRFTGFRPEETGIWHRSSFSLHGQVDAPLLRPLLLSATGRYERFSDVGGTVSGKLGLRLALSDAAAFRASTSTGFRPPALSQSHYGHVTAGRREDPDEPGATAGFEAGTFPVDAPEAGAVGASPLRGERSRSVSAGFAFEPADGLRFTIDGYATDVDDAILLSNPLAEGASGLVDHLLADFAAESVRFFSNAIDLRSYGVDARLTWGRRLGDASRLELGASAGWGQVRGRCPEGDIAACVGENEALRDESFRIYDGFDVFFLEEGRPDWRGRFGTRFTTGAFEFGLGANVYGAQEELRALGVGEHPHRIRLLEPKVTIDAGVHVDVARGWRLTVGGENLFDSFPTRVDAFGGIFPYRSFSAMGFNGRYLYARLQVS
ncbi:TonB-dependent receptor [Candidatus Palauibacter soopunensis]|uniref:TonB-dependent receptor plug domain-containing protein n=1 Tax=Candidatus Palauibacter soopunensis TaxID=3056739 RepID=UPI0023A314F5|nr:TonB-dependent receptor [Candidatus Palauibacter soopunensis]MDE2878467.1 TonB-dependent receptor [Candidatus Palauibacter soopunensis]